MEKLNFATLQLLVSEWASRNFEETPPYRPILGACEELGELAHAQLKSEQGIRGDAAKHEADAKDAVGDIIIYLTDYCNRKGFDLQQIVDETWDLVSKRNWKANPTTGTPSSA